MTPTLTTERRPSILSLLPPLEPEPVAIVPAAVADPPEPYCDKRALAGHFAMSVRWVEHRMKEGLPHEHMDGRARFQISEAERWLRENGHLKGAG
jgi:hypothetical protein